MPLAVQPNIVYVHSHDTGRHVQPYGHSVPTPNIQRLAVASAGKLAAVAVIKQDILDKIR